MINKSSKQSLRRMERVELERVLQGLPARHRMALDWFRERAGTEQPWPAPLPNGTRLATQAKGIYKPEWTDYALSVKQTLGSPYPDREPVWRDDGTWGYDYFREGEDLGSYTNRGLFGCLRDRVPVGVMRQTKPKPSPRYRVLGLALVAGYQDGYFHLEGFGAGSARLTNRGGPLVDALSAAEQASQEPYDPASVSDARERTLTTIVRRRGQRKFREALIQAYGGRCVVTGCDLTAVLEAAHVTPYLGPETNYIQNGLLLRADLHTLWDLGLLALHPETHDVIIADALKETEYRDLAGKRVSLPMSGRPSPTALRAHLEWAGL